MPIAFIYTVPQTFSQLRQWFFWHAADHTEISEAILAQKQINITGRVLEPVDLSSLDIWVELHQQTHNDQNEALGLNGQDLAEFSIDDKEKLRDWIWDNASEHLALRQALKI